MATAPIQSQHAMALGATGSVPVAATLTYIFGCISAGHLLALDGTTALSMSALLVWGGGVWAMTRGIKLPPLPNGNDQAGEPLPDATAAKT